MQSNYVFKFFVLLLATLLLSGAARSAVTINGKSIGCPKECGENYSIGRISTDLPIEEIIKDGNCKCTDCKDGEEKTCIVVAAAPGSETTGNVITFD
ncbi:hypothetical protein M9434_002849 [Picochlorum sp. BPE23]|nr:hypothetical protein M9434_002849 [Picochlorum sp. BPE23]KAI8104893.1 hypothetical protein M9435_000070 [Picochlorum sp. BPE23]